MTAEGAASEAADVDPRFARSVVRWLRAYPRRWRAARTAEVTDLLADLAPPGARRLDLRSGIGLVRAGWATRWREHPPLLPWLGYLLLDRRLDPRYRDWVLDDLEGALLGARRSVVAGLPVLAVLGAQGWFGGTAPTSLLAYWLPVLVLGGAVWSHLHRDRLVGKHLTIRPGEVVTPTARVHALVARTRLAAGPWSVAACVTAATSVVAAGTVLVLADRMVAVTGCGRACLSIDTVPVTAGYRTGVLAAAGVALGVGGLLALRTRRRLLRWTPAPQAARWVAPLRPATVGRLGVGAAGTTLAAAALPDLAAGLAAAVLVAAVLALPSLLVARSVVAARRTRATAGIEVLRAATGRPDRADRAVPGFLPATTWLPAGTIAPPAVDPPYPATPRSVPAPGRPNPYRPTST